MVVISTPCVEPIIMSSARTAATQSKAPADNRRRALEYVKRGVDFWAVGARRKAWIQFTKAAETDLHCPEAYFEKGRVQQTLGHPAAASKWYDRALQAAEAPGRKDIQAVREVVMGAHALRGIASWQSGSWEIARKEFHQAVAEGYEPSEFIRHLMGECELRLGHCKEALEEYEKIPWCEDGLMNYGLALFTSGDVGSAVSTMRRAFFLTPGEVTALLDEPAEGGTDRAGEEPAEEAGQDETVSGNEGANGDGAYADRCGDLWEDTEGALPFLRALWTDPQVRTELKQAGQMESILQERGPSSSTSTLKRRLARLRSPVRIHRSQDLIVDRLGKRLSA